jgi:hypothetical protein
MKHSLDKHFLQSGGNILWKLGCSSKQDVSMRFTDGVRPGEIPCNNLHPIPEQVCGKLFASAR